MLMANVVIPFSNYHKISEKILLDVNLNFPEKFDEWTPLSLVLLELFRFDWYIGTSR